MFMAQFGDFCKVASSYADVADFVTVYIEEAHAADGWAFSNNVSINIHRNIEDRIEAASRLLVQNPSFPVVCDDMTDNANYAYGGLFERLFVIHRGKIVYEGGRGPVFYFLSEVEEWLGKYKELCTSGRQQGSEKVVIRPVMHDINQRYTGSKRVWAKVILAIFKA